MIEGRYFPPGSARALPARVWVEREGDQGTWVRVVMREGRIAAALEGEETSSADAMRLERTILFTRMRAPSA